ncbi:MAG: AtpZ/AtpI family protein [Deltaproteobacteria bacterium]|nr:AtpZ/AtpI family protein [Deltaproteobacteria bacterium]MBW2053013.1 AtpZ/AtpI family protein [Deltaproteobacteria bacterium]MBW2141789.1 AtpZ/AtpI family protein [Deltaproteobacteria bacterium]MBW2324514.1 AtpZ/AtpI family protein [Deltaproteobacteria bacterium]
MAGDNYYKNMLKEMTLVTQLGLTMAGSILLCFAIGYFLDKWLGTRGIFLTIFIILGVLGGGWTVYRQIIQLDEAIKKDDSP